MDEPPLKFNKADFLLRNGEAGGGNVLSRVKQFLTMAPTSSSAEPTLVDAMATITDLSNLDSDDDDESGGSSSEESTTTDDDGGETSSDSDQESGKIRHNKRKLTRAETKNKVVEFEIHMVKDKENDNTSDVAENASSVANRSQNSLVEEVVGASEK